MVTTATPLFELLHRMAEQVQQVQANRQSSCRCQYLAKHQMQGHQLEDKGWPNRLARPSWPLHCRELGEGYLVWGRLRVELPQ